MSTDDVTCGASAPSVSGRPQVAQHEVPQRAENHHEADQSGHVAPEGQLAAVSSQEVLRGNLCDVTRDTAGEFGVFRRTPVEDGKSQLAVPWLVSTDEEIRFICV